MEQCALYLSAFVHKAGQVEDNTGIYQSESAVGVNGVRLMCLFPSSIIFEDACVCLCGQRERRRMLSSRLRGG